MAINTNPGSPLKQIATYNSSGNFVAAANTNIVFVSIHSASGGSGGSGQHRYSGGYQGGAGGAGKVGGAFVFVNPGGSHVVTVGAAGGAGAGAAGRYQAGAAGGSGGISVFDNALTAAGGTGGAGGTPNVSSSAGAIASDLTGSTNLSTVSPSGGIARTSTITTQATGGSAGGSAPSPGRYAPQNGGAAGVAGIIHIYG